jgi:hypothetical protein
MISQRLTYLILFDDSLSKSTALLTNATLSKSGHSHKGGYLAL